VQHPASDDADLGLATLGLRPAKRVYRNLPAAALYEHSLQAGLGALSRDGALVVETGARTGRSPNDRFVVDDATAHDAVDWGSVNKPISEDGFAHLREKIAGYLQARDLYVQDSYAGADPHYRLPVRVVSESPWHALFAANMFIPVQSAGRANALADFTPQLTVLHAPYLQLDGAADGCNSETVVVLHLGRGIVLVAGSIYAGEIKKSVFSALNFLLPPRGVLPMHCSANIGANGDTAIFFGLSGTGKTTLSADGTRRLIGDDEHGWSDRGVFNFEGGCYAKVIHLSPTAEPEIYAATRRFGTILENVVMDPATRRLDLDDDALTENTRASYPIDFIPDIAEEGIGGHPTNVVMLTADAFGVLPPISRLTPEQAMYHFLSGYTARVAGTEAGVKEPQATFSTCFGAPFMPRHPTVYAQLLGERIARHKANCWLVNTGWSGGGYGVGQRMEIAHTRSMVRAAIDGRLAHIETRPDSHFGLHVPTACPNVPADVLQPKATWTDQAAYEAAARDVAKRFEVNFEQFAPYVEAKVVDAGIRAAA
jgi:phosphoenolpyruvate carboxykinase (ATP)